MSLGIAINSTAKIDIVSVAITSRATNLSRFATLEHNTLERIRCNRVVQHPQEATNDTESVAYKLYKWGLEQLKPAETKKQLN